MEQTQSNVYVKDHEQSGWCLVFPLIFPKNSLNKFFCGIKMAKFLVSWDSTPGHLQRGPTAGPLNQLLFTLLTSFTTVSHYLSYFAAPKFKF